MNLERLKNTTILLFGKSRAFSQEEFFSQLLHHSIVTVKKYEDGVEIAVEGRMMTPYEQNDSEALYEEKKVEFITIDVLETLLAKEIDSDTLLMSLKLSHDKSRLKDFLTNTMISDELFFRLLKMYSFSNEDFFENDDNRDISAAFISRFYENIERNHNVQYATTGFIHLVAQTQSVELLKAISELKPLKFHPKIEMAIAMSLYIDESMQRRFLKSADEKILEALSFNKKLSKSIVEKFIDDETLGSNVARSIELDVKLFNLAQNYPTALALNDTLTAQMQEQLLALNIKEVNFALSLNDNLDEKIMQTLLKSEDNDIKSSIYENASVPIDVLEEAYKKGKYLGSLAKNENTPVEILYQLQLDARYERDVKTNASFGRHIQTENIGWL